MDVRKPEHLGYDSHWNWLMPIVEKIERTQLVGYEYTHDDKPASFRVAIFVNCCDICVANSTGDNLIEITAAPSKIEAVYSAVVQFIQWYNQQNKTNEPTT